MMILFHNKDTLGFWQSKGHIIELRYKESHGFTGFIWNEDRIIATVTESEIKNIELDKLKQLDLSKLKAIFRSMYLVISVYSDGAYGLSAYPRGLGGWNEDIHKDKTITWCKEMGMSDDEAKLVGAMCIGVDSGKTNPVVNFLSKEAQSWHFNKNKHKPKKAVIDGGPQDTRVQHAVECLNEAIKLLKHEPKESKVLFKSGVVSTHKECALTYLGSGLHPLQDLFAHTEDFVSKVDINLPCKIKRVDHHLLHMEADDPYLIKNKRNSPCSLDDEDKEEKYSQRYTCTKLLTKFYIKRFLTKLEINHDSLSSIITIALGFLRSHKGDQNLKKRQYQEFKDSLRLDELAFDDTNMELEKLMDNSRQERKSLG